MSCPASPSSRSRRDPGFQTDRGPHSRHGAECSHGRCQRSRTRSQAALRAVPSCLLLVVLIKALGVGFFVLKVMKKRKSLARPPCPTQMYTKQPPHTSGTHCTHHARTAGSLCNTLYSLSAGTDNRPPTTSAGVAARPRISRISEVYTHATEPSAVMISVSARAQDLKPPSELITSCPLCYTLLPPPRRAAQIRALGPARLWGLCDSLALVSPFAFYRS